jgi:hypothetical protein
MKTDGYTKLVLTAIAVGLLLNAAIAFVRLVAPGEALAGAPAPKAPTVQKVTICDTSGEYCAYVGEDSRLTVR